MTTRREAGGPPYVSFRAFLGMLDWLEQEGLPQAFDRSVWSKRLSGVSGAQMMTTFRFLGLVGADDSPTDLLPQLVFNRGQRKLMLKQVLRERYPAAFELDLIRATPGQLEDRFRQFGIQGSTLRKALAFFTHAALFCEIPLSPFLVKRKTAMRRATRGEKSAGLALSVPDPDELHPALTALLNQLKQSGPAWNSEEKHRWSAAWNAVVDLLYPASDVFKG